MRKVVYISSSDLRSSEAKFKASERIGEAISIYFETSYFKQLQAVVDLLPKDLKRDTAQSIVSLIGSSLLSSLLDNNYSLSLSSEVYQKSDGSVQVVIDCKDSSLLSFGLN